MSLKSHEFNLDHVLLYLVVMSLYIPLVWNHFSIFPALS